MDPATIALLSAGIGAAGSAASGYFSGQGRQETKMERTKRKLVDQLLASLQGNGPYSDLYSFDENTFNKSFVEPAQARFRNQIAPQIQQQYIAGGQQRGTGLDDTLTRAGVDLDAELNKYMYQAQQDTLNRKQGSINSILNQGAGAPQNPSGGQNALSGLGGYFSSPAFTDTISDYLKPKQGAQNPRPPQRPGYEPQYY